MQCKVWTHCEHQKLFATLFSLRSVPHYPLYYPPHCSKVGKSYQHNVRTESASVTVSELSGSSSENEQHYARLPTYDYDENIETGVQLVGFVQTSPLRKNKPGSDHEVEFSLYVCPKTRLPLSILVTCSGELADAVLQDLVQGDLVLVRGAIEGASKRFDRNCIIPRLLASDIGYAIPSNDNLDLLPPPTVDVVAYVSQPDTRLMDLVESLQLDVSNAVDHVLSAADMDLLPQVYGKLCEDLGLTQGVPTPEDERLVMVIKDYVTRADVPRKVDGSVKLAPLRSHLLADLGMSTLIRRMEAANAGAGLTYAVLRMLVHAEMSGFNLEGLALPTTQILSGAVLQQRPSSTRRILPRADVWADYVTQGHSLSEVAAKYNMDVNSTLDSLLGSAASFVGSDHSVLVQRLAFDLGLSAGKWGFTGPQLAAIVGAHMVKPDAPRTKDGSIKKAPVRTALLADPVIGPALQKLEQSHSEAISRVYNCIGLALFAYTRGIDLARI